jgi:general secretion pathway protein A
MFLRYFGFREDPFEATPDPRGLYNSPTHQEALASLMCGFHSNRGFTALIAPPGLGKTTLLFRFLDDIRMSARTVFLYDSLCEPLELVSAMLRDLGIQPGRNGVEMREQLKDIVVREARVGRRFVVVIDEAQNMSDDALEMVRLLTNFETSRAKLMQIVLCGQPKLFEKLMQPSLEQLRQRISTFCQLRELSVQEVSGYIEHRLKRVGYSGPPLFTEDALKLISEASCGIPRTINNLCFNALSVCCGLKSKQVDAKMAAEAIADLRLSPLGEEAVSTPDATSNVGRFEPKQQKHPVGWTKHWLRAAAVVIVGSAIGILASPVLQQLRSRVALDMHSLFEKAFPSSGPSVVSAARSSVRPGGSGLLNAALPSHPAASKVSPTSTDSNAISESVAVTVKPNQTLRDICVQHWGNCDSQRLHQVEALNPWMIDPDHIEAGQKLRLPGPPAEQVTANAAPVAGGRFSNEP